MTKNENTIGWRVNELEKNYDEIDRKIEKILTNHLPHINGEIKTLNGKIDVLDTKLKYSLIANGVQIVALVLGLVFLVKTN